MISDNFKKYTMSKLNLIDLQFLHLGIKNDGVFDENDIEQSELKKLGVGRILDQLASLKERKLIEMNKGGSFLVTSSAKHVLWDTQIPLWIRILRILEIKSQNISQMASFLILEPNQILEEVEDLRKRQLVLMSPLRTESGLMKMYEILPEGIEQIKKVQSGEIQIKPEITKPQIEVLSIIEQTIQEIRETKISQEKKDKIISDLFQIKEKLEI